jgi:hypothetical protein
MDDERAMPALPEACPFCGKDALVITGAGNMRGVSCDTMLRPWIPCPGNVKRYDYADAFDAIAAWNRRAPAAQAADAREDAERYRWLRANWPYICTGTGVAPNGNFGVTEVFLVAFEYPEFDTSTLDAAIDAARTPADGESDGQRVALVGRWEDDHVR